jgi:uncharacterized protein YqeY
LNVLEQVRADVISAMKSGERDVATALRLLVSELQKDLKEGAGDELAVLRREHKRRLDAATQFENANRPELAEKEQAEAMGSSTRSSPRPSPRPAQRARGTWVR